METDTLMATYNGAPNILVKGRRSTDKPLIILLAAVFTCWVGTIIYARMAGDSNKVFSQQFASDILATLTISRIMMIIGFSLLSSICCFLYVAILLKVRNITFATVGVAWFAFVGSVVVFVHYPSFFTFYVMIAAICSALLTQTLVHSEWFYLTEAIVKETCGIIKDSPKIVIFSLLWCEVCILFVVSGFMTHFYLSTITEQDGLTLPVYVKLLIMFNVFSANWIPWTVFNFGQMVVSGSFATWFWTKEKQDIPKNSISQCVKITTRYHIGTAANGAWLFGAINSLFALVSLLERTIRQRNYSEKLLFLIACNFFDVVVIRFVMFSAITLCAIHGQDYSKSVDYAINHLTRQPVRCLLMSKMKDCLLIMGLLIIFALMAIVTLCYLSPDMDPDEYSTLLLFIAMGSMFFVLPTLSMLSTGFNTIFLCLLEDTEINDGSLEKPYFMSDRLREALFKEGPPSWYYNCW